MRPLAPALLLILALPCSAEDLEAITLRDGRTLVGRYDETERKLYLRDNKAGKMRMSISVAPGDIAERKPWTDPSVQVPRAATDEDARRVAAASQISRAAATSAAVSDTIAAQGKQRREQEGQMAKRDQLAEAETRAAYWQEEGRWNFNPETMTAAQMDEHVRRTRAMLAEQKKIDDQAATAAERKAKDQEELRSFASSFRASVAQVGDLDGQGEGLPGQIRAAVRWLAGATHCFRPWRVDARQIRDKRQFDDHETYGNDLVFSKQMKGITVAARYSHRLLVLPREDPWSKVDLVSVSVALPMPATDKNIALLATMFVKGARLDDQLVAAYDNDFDKLGYFVQCPQYPPIAPVADGVPAMIRVAGADHEIVRATISGKPGEFLLRWIKPDLTADQIRAILAVDDR